MSKDTSRREPAETILRTMSIENPYDWNDDHPIGPKAIYRGISGNTIVTSPPRRRTYRRKKIRLCKCCSINQAASSSSLYCNDCKVERIGHYTVCPVSGNANPKVKNLDEET